MRQSRFPWAWILVFIVLVALLAVSAALQDRPANSDADGCGG